jgi:alpha-ketoglutarate-dependent taurine dioxygenase
MIPAATEAVLQGAGHDGLLAHTTHAEFVYVHTWRAGDLVMWDNRCLLHRAMRNYEMTRHRRILQRTVVKGTVPF